MDAIAKFTGWRFGTLHEELKKPEDLDIILSRLQDSLNEFFRYQSNSYHVSTVFGTAPYNEHFKQPSEILQAAEKNLDKAQLKAQEK